MLTVAFIVLLLNSVVFGKHLRMVTLISLSLMLSNIALAVATFLFNAEEYYILNYQF